MLRSLPLLVLGLCAASITAADEPPPTAVTWLDRYDVAVHRARQQQKMLWLVFVPGNGGELWSRLEGEIQRDAELPVALAGSVCARLPVDHPLRLEGKESSLLAHGAFRSMRGGSGLAVLDFAHPGAAYYGRVVTALPFAEADVPTAAQLRAVLALPPGDLATRTGQLASRWADRTAAAGVSWHDDYYTAYRAAERSGKMLLVYFQQPGEGAPGRRFEAETLAHAEVRRRLPQYECVRIPVDAAVPSGAAPVRLLSHAAFQEMLGRDGLAVIDLAHKDQPYYRHVVSAFPLLEQHWYTPARMTTILDLPPGSLTQRTMIYAVRVHPEGPASTQGEASAYLLGEAQSHSGYQARIGVQGHHAWASRFHRISAALPSGLLAAEVCAESWPGQRLLEAALDCVHCWRQSSGHWQAVRSYHPVYGYDMKRGRNGIWYATGIFGEGRR